MTAKKNLPKIFVLDTSVIIFNHHALESFEENDVAIPITVLEELDNFKKGNDMKNFEAREFIRIMDSYSKGTSLTDWIPLEGKSKGKFKVVMEENTTPDATKVFGDNKNDHKILNAAIKLRTDFPDRKVVLVTKDVNLRIKAKSLDIHAEDYETGKVKNVDELYKGNTTVEGIESGLIDSIYQTGFCEVKDLFDTDPIPNHYFILKNGRTSVLAFFNPVTYKIERVEKRTCYNIKP